MRKSEKVESSSEIGRDFAYWNDNEHKGVSSRDIDDDVMVNKRAIFLNSACYFI